MRPTRFASAALLAALVIAATATAQQQVPNSKFTNWAKFKKGASVTLHQYTSTGGYFVVSQTLAEVTAEKVVVEVAVVVEANGQEIRTRAKDLEHPKALTEGIPAKDIRDHVIPEWVWNGKPPAGAKIGEEKLKIGGVEYQTKWFTTTDPTDGAVVKGWVSRDVPGTVVKVTVTTAEGGKEKTKTLMEVVAIKLP